MAIVLAVLFLLTLGCTGITVTNNTEESVRVTLQIPDGGGTTASQVLPGGVKVKTSITGGHYLVGALKSRDLIDKLATIKETLRMELLDPTISVENAEKIKQDILALQAIIEEAENQAKNSTAICTGNVPDWGAVEAVITESDGKFVISCSVNKPEINFTDIVNGGQ